MTSDTDYELSCEIRDSIDFAFNRGVKPDVIANTLCVDGYLRIIEYLEGVRDVKERTPPPEGE